jgi:hypothetical protein
VLYTGKLTLNLPGSGMLDEGEIRRLFERMVGPRLPSRCRALAAPGG